MKVDFTDALDHGLPEAGIAIEPSPRWVRVRFGGEFIADSRRVLLVRERGRTPSYYFPIEDVRMQFLKEGEHTRSDPLKGDTHTWSIEVGDHQAGNAAWTHPSPPPHSSALAGHITFNWHNMDAWYEEEEEIFVHPRDPYKRVDIVPSSRHIRVELEGIPLADSRRPFLLFETGLPTRYYLPAEDVRIELLEPSELQTQCPYKGVASYWSIRTGDKLHRDLVWSYPDPIPENPKIRGLLCFYNEKVDIYLDGELQPRPKTFWS